MEYYCRPIAIHDIQVFYHRDFTNPGKWQIEMWPIGIWFLDVLRHYAWKPLVISIADIPQSFRNQYDITWKINITCFSDQTLGEPSCHFRSELLMVAKAQSRMILLRQTNNFSDSADTRDLNASWSSDAVINRLREVNKQVWTTLSSKPALDKCLWYICKFIHKRIVGAFELCHQHTNS